MQASFKEFPGKTITTELKLYTFQESKLGSISVGKRSSIIV